LTIALSLFGYTIFQLDFVRSLPDAEGGGYVGLGIDTGLDEEMEPDITANTYGFGPPTT
jgi:hypothetical protein